MRERSAPRGFVAALALAAIGATASAPAHAGPSAAAGGDDGGDELRVAQSRALVASLVGTLLPIGLGLGIAVVGDDGAETGGGLLFGSGLIFGPFAGYAAGGCPNRGSTGVLIRVATGFVGVLLAGAVASSSGGGFAAVDPAPFVVVGAAVGLILVDDVIDIVRVRGAVRKEREAKHSRMALRISPWFDTAEGAVGVGVQLSLVN